MIEEIPNRVLEVPVDQAVESGMHYVVLSRGEGHNLGFRVRNAPKYDRLVVRRISKAILMRAIRRCKEDPDYEVAWRTDRFRKWIIEYSKHCRQNQISPADTPAKETVKFSWFSLVGIQVKIFTDRVFPWQWRRKK